MRLILSDTEKFTLIIEGNNVTYPVIKENFDNLNEIVNIQIKGFRKDFSSFEYNHRPNINEHNVNINIGHILSGQKVDFCIYLKKKIMPICNHILIKPGKIRFLLICFYFNYFYDNKIMHRFPMCSSTIDTIEFTYFEPALENYDSFVVCLEMKNGSKLLKNVPRGTRRAMFTDLESGQAYSLYAMTIAGQDNIPNFKKSDVITCHTLPELIVYPIKTNKRSETETLIQYHHSLG